MLDDELKNDLMDMGALGYTAEQCALVLGKSIDDFNELIESGGREFLEIGEAKFQFVIDRKLMEMAAKGDLKAMKKLEQMKRVKD